jgi:hypothetical protein
LVLEKPWPSISRFAIVFSRKFWGYVTKLFEI